MLSYSLRRSDHLLVLNNCHTCHEIKNQGNSRQTSGKRDMEISVGRNNIACHHAQYHIPRQEQEHVAQAQTALQRAILVEKDDGKTKHATNKEQSKKTTHRIVGSTAQHHHKVVHLEAHAHSLRLKAAERQTQAHQRNYEGYQQKDRLLALYHNLQCEFKPLPVPCCCPAKDRDSKRCPQQIPVLQEARRVRFLQRLARGGVRES